MWTVRKAVGDETKEILKLHALVYGRPRTDDEWAWLYRRNPSGAGYAWLAVHDDQGLTVSARPIFPWRMRILGDDVLATQAGDAMTHPEFRGRGLFTSLVKAAWSDLREQGIPLSYSFSVAGSLSVYRKVKIGPEPDTGCHEIGLFRRMVKPLRVQELLAPAFGRFSKWLGRAFDGLLARLTERTGPGWSTPLAVTEIRRFDQRFDALWARASRAFKVIGVRDSQFLNWRYIDTPKKRHTVLAAEDGAEVLGFAVVELTPSSDRPTGAYLVEIFAIPDARIVRFLLAAVAKYCRERGASRITAWALEGSDYAGTLRRGGFFSRADRLAFALHVHRETPYTAALLDPKSWFISLGDRDVETVG